MDTQAKHPDLSGVSDKMVSGGRLNVAKALAKLTPPPPDTKAPSVSGVTPTDQPNGVAINAPVTVTFDEPMNQASLNTAFTLVKQDTMENVGTSVTYDATNNKVTLDHPDLAPGTKYTATMTTDAKDAAGYALIAEQVWSFTTTAVAAPTNLTAARSGSGSSQRINLTWTDTSSNETNFTVERCTGSSSYCASQVSWSVRTATLAANTESYADAGLSRRTTYTYIGSKRQTALRAASTAIQHRLLLPKKRSRVSLTEGFVLRGDT